MNILIVDDHAVVREGVRRLLSALPGVSFLEAGDAHTALALYRAELPDVTVLDINLAGGSGLQLLVDLRAADRHARVVMFTMHAEPAYAARALRAGAAGYVSKSASAEELVEAVKRVAEGGRYVDRELAAELALLPAASDDPLQRLSAREIEILRLLGEGKSLNEIAATFGIAYKTVANTCTRLKEKLGLERTADLIRISIESLR